MKSYLLIVAMLALLCGTAQADVSLRGNVPPADQAPQSNMGRQLQSGAPSWLQAFIAKTTGALFKEVMKNQVCKSRNYSVAPRKYQRDGAGREIRLVLAGEICGTAAHGGALCQRHQVKGYPSIVFSHPTQGWDDWYGGAHTAEALYEFAAGYLQSDIVHIQSAREFERRVLDGGDFWLVDFYAPWCGPCMQLKPHLRRVSVELRGLAKVAMVDCAADAINGVAIPGGGYDEGPCTGLPQYPYLKAYPRDPRLKAEGAPHRLENPGEAQLHLIEVQSGNYISEDDIVRLADTYGRS